MSTPRDIRARERHQRQDHLQAPRTGLGRADTIRSRSVSPTTPGSFQFPPNPPPPKQSAEEVEDSQFLDALNAPTMATPEQLAVIREELRNELRSEIRAELRYEAAAAGAAIPDAIKRKPEIPAFDKNHIDHWIRRTENAFVRALITSPREKFAFLEPKFPVDLNPRINDFLWGSPTQARWDEFVAYLRQEYGPTKQQRASIFIDGFKRDGRRPSQYAALLNDKTKNVTIEDIKKEMLVREMPTDVQRMLQERIERLSFEDAAKIADSYFDQEGNPRHISKTAPINAIHDEANSYTEENDGTNDVNAVGRNFPNRRNGAPNYNPTRGNRSRPQKGWHARTAKDSPNTTASPRNPTHGLCFYHDKHGDSAERCVIGCPRYDEKRFRGNGRAGLR